MSYQVNPDKWGKFLLAGKLAIVAVLMFAFPDAFADFITSGRRAWVIMLIKVVWGYTGGVIALSAAGFVGFRAIRSDGA